MNELLVIALWVLIIGFLIYILVIGPMIILYDLVFLGITPSGIQILWVLFVVCFHFSKSSKV